MLRKEHIEAILPLAQQLDARGIFLAAEGGSPVQVLSTALCLKQTDVAAVGDGEYQPDVTYLANLSDDFGATKQGVYSEHSKHMEELKTGIVQAVSNHLNFAKNIAKPLIVEYHAAVAKRIQTYSFNSENNFSIVHYDLPAPLKFDSVIEEVVKTCDLKIITSMESFDLPQAADLVEFVMQTAITGDKQIDDAVKMWLATKGDAFMVKVWQAVFSKTGPIGFEQLMQQPDKADSAALVFLLCRKLMDNPPEGTGYSLGVYNSTILRIQNQVAIRLQGVLQEWENAVKLGQVIRFIDDSNIEVYAHMYATYLNEGGDNQLLMAASIQSKPVIYITELQSKQADLRQRWTSYNLHAQATAANNKQLVLKAILREELIAMINANLARVFSNLPGQESTNWDTIQHNQYKPFLDVVKCADEYIAQMTERYLADLWDACLDIVTKCLFPHTSAHQILSYVHKACVQNPELPVEEAVLLATNKYVCSYVADQLVIVKT